MLRLLALSLLALAAPQAAAQQVHPCQAETPPCSLGLAQALRDEEEASRHLDEADRELAQARRELAQALRDEEKASRYLDELIRETGPGTAIPWETPAERSARRNRMRQPRHHVPYPLSRELLTGAVNPCDSAHASCPPKLDRIYDGLSEARRRDDQSRLEMYQRSLRYYYRTYQP